MNPFNKFELIGIFASISVMVLALVVLRFETGTFAISDRLQNQSAVVAASQNNNIQTVVSSTTREATLRNAFSVDGTLTDLIVDDIRIGSGATVSEGNTVFVHYIGTLQDGTKFDSSYDRNNPYSFTVGKGEVIEGWDKGLVGMKVGGQRILVIPGSMAYGNRQVGPIPPNAPLVFRIELIEIAQ